MTIRKLFLALLLFASHSLMSQTAISGVVNTYNTLATRIPGNCGDTIYVSSLPTFAVGDLLLFYNPTGASFDTTNTAAFGDSISLGNSGKYAFAYVAQVSATLMMILDRSIGPDFGNGSMVIRVPEYSYADVTATITAPAFVNGTGGIVAISANKLRLSADIDVSEKGYQGGFLTRNMGYSCGSSDYRYPASNNGGAPKGDGIGNIPGWMKNGRGHFLNGGGGGNNHNAGGGGGANGGSGGKGGDEWSGCSPVAGIGGLGGQALRTDLIGRVYMGGGGGSGHNNVSGLSSEGGNGGGIVFLLVDTLVNNGGGIYADGGNGKSISSGAEGSGGGGAGGTIIFTGPHAVGASFFYARGGLGGNSTGGTAGPGGGGGGGIIWSPQPSLGIGASLINGGSAGHLANVSNNYGSTAGADGFVRGVQNLTRPFPLSSGGSLPANFLGSDTLICAIDSVLLAAPTGSAYLWSTGATTQSINARGAGIYWVQVQIGGCVYTDSMRISNYPGGTGNFLGPNRFLCTGTSLNLSTTINGNYLWSTGATTNSISINSGGWYWLDIRTGAACPVRDSIFITEDNFGASAISVDTAICASESYTQFYPQNWLAFWPDGSSGNSFEFRNSGTFLISVFNTNGCERRDTIRISTLGVDTILKLFPNSDTTVCQTDGYAVDFSYLKGQIFWNDGLGGKIRNLRQSRRYIVRYEEGCYSTRDTLNLLVIDCDTCQIFFPNAFSPNGDGLNDTYRPISACELEELEIRIIDRWGELIYESTGLLDAWDGTFKGSDCMQGIYIYDVIYRLPYQSLQRKSGVLHLRH